MMSELKINPKFKGAIPPLSDEEYAGLRESIMSEGCRDAIIVWDGTIVDGHNRHSICTELNIPFRTHEKHFEDEDEALMWILTNQLCRRNLTDVDRIRLVLKHKDFFVARAKENCRLGGGDKKSENAKSGSPILANPISAVDTRKELAKRAEVSNGTFSKAERVENEAPAVIREAMGNKTISIDEAARLNEHLKKLPEDEREGKAKVLLSEEHKKEWDRICYEEKIVKKLHNIISKAVLGHEYICEECVDVYIKKSCESVGSALKAIDDEIMLLTKLKQLFLKRDKEYKGERVWKIC